MPCTDVSVTSAACRGPSCVPQEVFAAAVRPVHVGLGRRLVSAEEQVPPRVRICADRVQEPQLEAVRRIREGWHGPDYIAVAAPDAGAWVYPELRYVLKEAATGSHKGSWTPRPSTRLDSRAYRACRTPDVPPADVPLPRWTRATARPGTAGPREIPSSRGLRRGRAGSECRKADH